jgi:predicted transcriptional regulator
MKRVERIYCEILEQIIQKQNNKLTQKQLSKDCQVSIGTVNYALKPLEQMGIIEKKQRNFKTINPKKLLLYWASIRNLKNEIIYTTYSTENIRNIEQTMPPCIYTAYSAYKYLYKDTPADYGEIYAYCKPEEIKKRFPINKKTKINNIFILKPDNYLQKKSKKSIAPTSLIYVDLWNLNTWYANEFIKNFDKKIGL